MAFCTLGPIWSRKASFATWGRFIPFPHAQRENRPIFRSSGFPLNQRWIMCKWFPQYRWRPPEHPRNTSHALSASCCRLPIRPVDVCRHVPLLRWHVCVHACTRVCHPTADHACLHICPHTRLYLCLYTCIYTYEESYAHVYAHAYAHIYTCI